VGQSLSSFQAGRDQDESRDAGSTRFERVATGAGAGMRAVVGQDGGKKRGRI
jgi:hypothetical protein